MKTRLVEYGSDETRLVFRCEGCGGNHAVPVTGSKAWGWNGDREAPVLTPSVLVNMVTLDGHEICHSFVGCNGAQPGEIIFLNDCTHALAGQVRPLVEWRESEARWKLVQDGDCHWYVIPADKAADWSAWRDLPDPDLDVPEHEFDDTAWTVPDYAEAVGGAPSLVTFNADGTYTIG